VLLEVEVVAEVAHLTPQLQVQEILQVHLLVKAITVQLVLDTTDQAEVAVVQVLRHPVQVVEMEQRHQYLGHLQHMQAAVQAHLARQVPAAVVRMESAAEVRVQLIRVAEAVVAKVHRAVRVVRALLSFAMQIVILPLQQQLVLLR
jgi:hypothetical protein